MAGSPWKYGWTYFVDIVTGAFDIGLAHSLAFDKAAKDIDRGHAIWRRTLAVLRLWRSLCMGALPFCGLVVAVLYAVAGGVLYFLFAEKLMMAGHF